MRRVGTRPPDRPPDTRHARQPLPSATIGPVPEGVSVTIGPVPEGVSAWRALTELVQCLLGVARETEPPRADLTGLAAYPALHACGRFDLTAHLTAARPVPYYQSQEASDEPRDHLDRLVTKLSAAGYPSYYRIVATLPEQIAAVHTIVPGLERFMLITDGLLVLPGHRGRAAAASGRQPDESRAVGPERVGQVVPAGQR